VSEFNRKAILERQAGMASLYQKTFIFLGKTIYKQDKILYDTHGD
jgi:hypothetical protein